MALSALFSDLCREHTPALLRCRCVHTAGCWGGSLQNRLPPKYTCFSWCYSGFMVVVRNYVESLQLASSVEKDIEPERLLLVLRWTPSFSVRPQSKWSLMLRCRTLLLHFSNIDRLKCGKLSPSPPGVFLTLHPFLTATFFAPSELEVFGSKLRVPPLFPWEKERKKTQKTGFSLNQQKPLKPVRNLCSVSCWCLISVSRTRFGPYR